MIKHLQTIVLSLVFLYSSPGNSQVILEPFVGLNYSWITKVDQLGFNYQSAYRPVFGVGTEVYISTRLLFTPKIMYSALGNKEKSGTNTLIRLIHYNTYINLPLEFKYTIKNNFKFNLGINTGFWLKNSVYRKTETSPWQKSVYDFSNPVNSNFQKDNRFDLAIRAGFRFDSPFLEGKLKWELTYNHGLVPLVQPFSPAPNYEYNYNRWVQLLLIYPLEFIK